VSSGDKIIESIRKESQARIDAITKDAEKNYNDVMEKARKQADDIRHGGEHKVQLQSQKLLNAYKSREELEKRNALLKTKRFEIEKAFNHIYEYILGLDSKRYFDLVLKLAGKLGDLSGTIYFNSRDLKRLPKDMSERFAKCGIKAQISSVPDDSIESGFILKHGDIEENMSFLSVMNDKREIIEDLIGRELFKD